MSKSNIAPHWSFWLICVVGLIWSLMGCLNFISQMDSEMVSEFPQAAQDLINSRPIWATLGFAIAVFGGFLGDVLLALKKSISYHVFLASFVGVIITNVHTFSISGAPEILIGSLLSLLVSGFLIWYSNFAKRKEWLS